MKKSVLAFQGLHIVPSIDFDLHDRRMIATRTSASDPEHPLLTHFLLQAEHDNRRNHKQSARIARDHSLWDSSWLNQEKNRVEQAIGPSSQYVSHADASKLITGERMR